MDKRTWYWWAMIWLQCITSSSLEMYHSSPKNDNITKHSVNLWQETIKNYKSSFNALADSWECFLENIRLLAKVARNYWSHMPIYKWRQCQGLSIYAYGRLHNLLHLFNTDLLAVMNTLSLPFKNKPFYWLV